MATRKDWMESDAKHAESVKEDAEPVEFGWGRVAKGSTFAIRFVWRDGSHLIAPYMQLNLSPEPSLPRNTETRITLRYGMDTVVVVTGKKLDVIADRITASRLETLREGGGRDGTLVESIEARRLTEEEAEAANG